MSKNTETILIRITPEIKAIYQKLADEDKRPLAQYVRVLLETYGKDYLKGREIAKQAFKNNLTVE